MSNETVKKVGNYRWTICALLFFATTINYMDRQVLGILAPTLQREIGWNEIDYGNIVVAFQLAYAFGLLIAGHLMDRFGTRLGYAVAITVWSVAAMGHALARSVAGFALGFLLMKLMNFILQKATPLFVNRFFARLQIFSGAFMAFTHGMNDAQKTMGIITLALVTGGYLQEFAVPKWIILLCATMIALGTAIGGWRLIRTLGGKLYKIRPVDGFTAQLASASVIIGASLLGGPVSTTQVVSSAIMGVGAAERVNKVRWGVSMDILRAWLLTIPIAALLGAGLFWVFSQFIH